HGAGCQGYHGRAGKWNEWWLCCRSSSLLFRFRLFCFCLSGRNRGCLTRLTGTGVLLSHGTTNHLSFRKIGQTILENRTRWRRKHRRHLERRYSRLPNTLWNVLLHYLWGFRHYKDLGLVLAALGTSSGTGG